MKEMTYDMWMAAGYCVRKGEKSMGRDRHGRPTFKREQVEERSDFMRPKYSDSDRLMDTEDLCGE
jgi:hypothetical protein